MDDRREIEPTEAALEAEDTVAADFELGDATKGKDDGVTGQNLDF